MKGSPAPEAMKLAEALLERKAVKTAMEDLKARAYRNALVQEGEPPSEDPLVLLTELERAVDTFSTFVAGINRANGVARLADGMPLGEALVRRDMLRYLHLVYGNLADKATPGQSRYSNREIKLVPAIEVAVLRRRADELAKACRVLDAAVQATNWLVDFEAPPGR